MPEIDLTGFLKGARDRVTTLISFDPTEVVEILRDTHRILRKFEEVVDRMDQNLRDFEHRVTGIEVTPARIRRLEEAVLNIERATSGVEAAMNALPKVLRQRIFGGREGV
jgi:hypothetical protein